MLLRSGIFLVCIAVLSACSGQRPISRPVEKREPAVTRPSQPAPVYQAPEPAAAETAAPGEPEWTTGGEGPLRLALLLPLSGTLASSSEALRDSFLAAHFGSNDPAQIRIYDSGVDANGVRGAYGEALRDGAQVIVGPLRKEDVQVLAENGAPAVPLLALNYLDAGRAAPVNFYQFGLSAEDEARDAARDAAQAGLRRALTLTPQGEWGERALQAFQQAFAAYGGVISSAERYDAALTDFSTPIRALLAIDASRERHRALTSLLGNKPEFEPRRRADADLVFFAARGEAARQMAPQLRFHRASGLPLYATAQVYPGGEPGADLNGVHFCDGPWMIDRAGVWADARNETQALFAARAAELARLSALGHDAYTLALLLARGRMPTSALAGATGSLRLSGDGVIRRELSCVEVAGSTFKAAR